MGSKYNVDIVGQRFSRLVALEKIGTDAQKHDVWRCRCDCGKETNVSSRSLITGHTKSCGCLQREKAARIGDRSRTHGDVGTPLYGIWAAMKRRCYNKNVIHYDAYGGRGIHVCDEWQKYEPFKQWAIENGYKDGARLSIERKDVNGNYEPSNCCWIPLRKQGKNTRRTRHVEYKGKLYALSDIAEITGLSMRTIQGRYERGWSPERIFETPLMKNQYE